MVSFGTVTSAPVGHNVPLVIQGSFQPEEYANE
jgi:hypothetical protein